MTDLMHVIRKRFVRFSAAGLLLAGATAAPIVLSAGAADAAACGTATPAGTACTLTGTFTLTAGALNLTSPTALAWTGTANGLDQKLVDTTAAHQSYTVNDATGSGVGWHVTLTSTTFTNGSATLPNTGTFSTNGSLSSQSATGAPTPACTALATCLLPGNTTTYPVNITTAATSPTTSTIYDTAAASGLGSIVVGGGANPVAWWLSVPASAIAGSYTSTITLAIVSAP